MRLVRGAPDLTASPDGAFIACAGARLSLYDARTQARLAAAVEPFAGEAEIGFIGPERLLAVVRGEGRTQLHGFAVPSLELLATLELDGRLVPLAFTAARALLATESLEQPRVVAITTKILVEPIAMREPLMLATAAPEERLLVASRTREAQLECWDPQLRRALFRLNLPLMPRAERAGFSARRRLLWVASTSPTGTLEVFRFSDGRLQARAELGAPIVGADGDPESPRLVVATRARADETVVLTELDFAHGERRTLAPPVAPVAFCVVEGAAAALVVHAGGEAAPVWMSLGAAPAAATIAPTLKPARAQPAATGAVTSSSDWRAKLHGQAAGSSTATATTPPGATATPAPTAPARSRREPAPRLVAVDEEAAPHWRDLLCDWAAGVLAHPKRAAATPAIDPASTLGIAVERLALDARPARALALVYGARLVGHGDGVPAATLARALADGAATRDDDWDEALGRGLCGQLGLVRARAGTLRLSAAAARFLDGYPPRIAIVPGGGGEAELPHGRVRVDAGAEPLADVATRLAHAYGYDVALLAVPGQRPRRALAAMLAEARLHGAWPLVDVDAEPPAWLDVLDDGPTVIAIRGPVPHAFADLATP